MRVKLSHPKQEPKERINYFYRISYITMKTVHCAIIVLYK